MFSKSRNLGPVHVWILNGQYKISGGFFIFPEMVALDGIIMNYIKVNCWYKF